MNWVVLLFLFIEEENKVIWWFKHMPKAIQLESEVEVEPIMFELQRYTLNN